MSAQVELELPQRGECLVVLLELELFVVQLVEKLDEVVVFLDEASGRHRQRLETIHMYLYISYLIE